MGLHENLKLCCYKGWTKKVNSPQNGRKYLKSIYMKGKLFLGLFVSPTKLAKVPNKHNWL